MNSKLSLSVRRVRSTSLRTGVDTGPAPIRNGVQVGPVGAASNEAMGGTSNSLSVTTLWGTKPKAQG